MGLVTAAQKQAKMTVLTNFKVTGCAIVVAVIVTLAVMLAVITVGR